ncbi:MAG: hypothetical protein ACLR8P_13675 [Clostridium fessum]
MMNWRSGSEQEPGTYGIYTNRPPTGRTLILLAAAEFVSGEDRSDSGGQGSSGMMENRTCSTCRSCCWRCMESDRENPCKDYKKKAEEA